MKKIEQFQITSMTIAGFKSYQDPTELTFGNLTIITGGSCTMKRARMYSSACASWMKPGAMS